MKEMGAADFKARCLQVLDSVRRTRREVTITKRGVPFAKLVPVEPPAALVLGALAGRFEATSDIVSSPFSDREWEALEKERRLQWDRWLKAPRGRRRAARGPASR